MRIDIDIEASRAQFWHFTTYGDKRGRLEIDITDDLGQFLGTVKIWATTPKADEAFAAVAASVHDMQSETVW